MNDKKKESEQSPKAEIERLLREAIEGIVSIANGFIDEHPIGKIEDALSLLEKMGDVQSCEECGSTHFDLYAVGDEGPWKGEFMRLCADCAPKLLELVPAEEPEYLGHGMYAVEEPPAEEPVITEEQAAKGLEKESEQSPKAEIERLLRGALECLKVEVVLENIEESIKDALSLLEKMGEKWDGEYCMACRKPYETVYRIPDNVWNKISPTTNGGGLLCPSCADFLARIKGYNLYWEATESGFPTDGTLTREPPAETARETQAKVMAAFENGFEVQMHPGDKWRDPIEDEPPHVNPINSSLTHPTCPWCGGTNVFVEDLDRYCWSCHQDRDEWILMEVPHAGWVHTMEVGPDPTCHGTREPPAERRGRDDDMPEHPYNDPSIAWPSDREPPAEEPDTMPSDYDQKYAEELLETITEEQAAKGLEKGGE